MTDATAPPARILIVDDEPLNVDYLEQELEARGYRTESARNGLEALERVGADPPDLVLLDVMMPGMDGISALRVLKDDPETRLIPVVLMTALNAVEDRVRGIEAGADDFLTKPVDERELLARIKTALGLKRTIDEAVGELRSTSAYLERYGRQERDVAVLAVRWRLDDESLPEEALEFVGRRRRDDAEARVRGLGGIPVETERELLLAVFDAPDRRARSVAAVDAALAVADDDASGVTATAAVAVGLAHVGSRRTAGVGEARWEYGAEGVPVDDATELARRSGGGVLVTAGAAELVRDRLTLRSVGDGAYDVLGRVAGAEVEARPRSERRLRTVLVTDIVASTRTVEEIGDRAWGQLLTAHERAIRSELVHFHGEEIDTAGDGFLASFDSPAAAIRCAFAIHERSAELGLSIRAGVHTGEVQFVDGTVLGIAVHVAARIAARAGAGEVLVSATTRELAAGAGLHFDDRGEHELKGVAEPRRLYAVDEAT
jgi:CheY-like chemotaxis protein/class 3 adenylate cyclase